MMGARAQPLNRSPSAWQNSKSKARRSAGVTLAGSDFASLLKKEFKPKTEEAKSAVEQAVQTLAQQALANAQVISNDAIRSIEA